MLNLIPAILMALTPADSARSLDFWVGTWVMDSSQTDDPNTKGTWQKKVCTNKITREFGSKVIVEHFEGLGLKGGSWSSFNETKKTWQQTWVDDSGAYLLFEGGMDGNEFVLTQTNSPKGRARMRFANITAKSFDWYWESSPDGNAWKLNWHLKYQRKAK